MAGDRRSIGQVLKILTEQFPDVSISKIRFLESEGLLSPDRAPSGYRRYSDADIERLRYILEVQKSHYLPLKVIREHLELMDQGLEPPKLDSPTPVEPEAAGPGSSDAHEVAEALTPRARAPRNPIRITRRELLRLSGLSDAALTELERHALVVPRRGTVYYGRDALTIAVAARKLAGYGMDARHLRAIKQAAEREAGLVDAAVNVTVRRGQNPRQVTQDVMQLILHAHAAILRQSITQ
ncbi:transcriptional regulator FtsR [Nigerium massiliense]|uniref:transcriptional regulator FtsR n=1 Tax=Nigerium massiliense TaxID=1522317 RepID=UPI0005909156|nr:MerR family transcriptional regulator [Nigerium massiliense]